MRADRGQFKILPYSRLPLASSCLRTMRQKLSALFQAFPLPEKKFSELHFFRQKWEAFPYVKASPRGEAPPRGDGEGRSPFLIF